MMLYRTTKTTRQGNRGARTMYVASAITGELNAFSTAPYASPGTAGVVFQARGKEGSQGEHPFNYHIELTRRDLIELCRAAGIETT